MSFDFNLISDVDVRAKTIIVRVDLNSSVKTGKLLVSPKIIEHTKTLKTLSDNGARLIVLSHQGRKGKADFIDLEGHRYVLEKLLKKEVKFFSWNQKYVEAIKKLKDGEILLMDNTRFLEFETESKTPEEHAKEQVIESIANVSDFFVLDALSVAHRSHATVVGFIPLLKSFVGPALHRELIALEKIAKVKNGTSFILGGGKPEDSLYVMEKMLSMGKAKNVLLGGIIGELSLLARGVDLGEKEVYLREKGYLDLLSGLKKVLTKYDKQIFSPVDVAISYIGERKEISLADLPSDEMIFDVGEQTVKEYSTIFKNSEIIIFNGPFGRFENYQFSWGTKEILFEIKKSKSFSLIGGGDTVTAAIRLGFKKEEFSHISLAGKALLQFLTGEELPGLIALRKKS